MMHKPVLTKEVLEYLDPKPNENFIDGTIGQGGHALLLLEKTGPKGKVLGIDLDMGQIQNSRSVLAAYTNRTLLVCDSYASVKEITERLHFAPVNGILLDLGYSSWHLAHSTKGFTFLKDETLDMRYSDEIPNPTTQGVPRITNNLTASKIVNEYPENEIKKILEECGEEKFAKQIAKAIVRQREIQKIQTTFQLKEIIEKAIPRKFQHGKIHCATKSFQALRISVNDELGNLQKALPAALSVLTSRGRLAVISFHSLEDRTVKNFFRDKEKEGIVKILTKKPVMAENGEVLQNPRARSAKLRAIIKI